MTVPDRAVPIIHADARPVLDAKRWRALLSFERRVRGQSGRVSIPTSDFLALMDAVRSIAPSGTADVDQQVAAG